jgi:hypothetical protein
MEKRMNDIEKLASDLEHYAQVLHDQVRRGYHPADPSDIGALQQASDLLDRISLELCEAQEADEDRQDTEDYLNNLLDADGLKASLRALSIYAK